ncbi:LOW QUALITY PROTEIN: uncharacterized protein LOC124804739 [Schistocerca piceifrons]|uniref:LOW QUALITY PROTEIN: uncharacterized protein LOC124804739 n=1 Tax=Schistocerca piceifrons TaxID=274613 RepID=UPI001F5F53EA|nr:LOW QUALITY PROTEIN: uncharacterized protein LOC124804739 [Schistocerca piceifrons]
MFSTPEKLAKRTGKKDANRQEYLGQLVNEFRTTKSKEAKEQVLANLANFAYDPINYEYLRHLKVIDLFLDQLSEANSILLELALGGLCNLALDDENRDYILHNNGVHIISSCLSSPREETVIAAITTLIFLVTPESKLVVATPEVVSCISQLCSSPNPRITNLAKIFIEDYVSERSQLEETVENSPSVEIKKIMWETFFVCNKTVLKYRSVVHKMLFSDLLRETPTQHNCMYSSEVKNIEKLSSAGKMTKLEVGNEASVRRTITVEDLDKFGSLIGDYNTVHSGVRPIVHGAFLNGLVSGVIGTKLPGPGSIVVQELLRFPNSCHVGDTVNVTVRITEVRKLVSCSFSCVCESDNKVVMEGTAKLIIKS